MGLLVDRKKKVIAYCRHSRKHAQENSIPLQLERLDQYAAENNLEIIHVEKDEGESGLTADRPGFQAILHDWAKHPERTKLFEGILFFDVSRMGRFQKLDEFGYYTYTFKQHGKWVWYVELGMLPAVQDPMHHLMIAMKQAAAADYSAKLSDRVWHGCVKISRDGYSAGGTPCYSLERILLNEQRRFVCVLNRGEHKQISNQRVTFQLRNDETTKAVRTIFQLFVELDESPRAIAGILNQHRLPSPNGGRWKSSAILRILRNEAYIGTRVYNKTWKRLKQPSRANPRSEWVICPNAFPVTVRPEVFFAAQKRLQALLPSLRYRGQQLIRRMERMLMTEILELLHTHDVASKPSTRVPFIFSIRNLHEHVGHWNFTIPEAMREYDRVIGVGLTFDRTDAVECFFEIPTGDFGPYNVLVFPEDGERYQDYRITKEQAKTWLLANK